MSIRFDGRVALVTGAGSGLGKSYALGFAARGATVVVNDLGSGDGSGVSDAAQTTVDKIKFEGGQAIAAPANVADFDQVKAVIDKAVKDLGRVDIVVNNAGVLKIKALKDMDLAVFRQVMDIHLMGAVHTSKAVWNTMEAQNYGRIVMTSSSAGLYGSAALSAYGAAKAALVGLMNALSMEGEPHDIRVNAIAPTAATPMTQALLTPQMLRLMGPEHVAPAVLYLASEAAPTKTIIGAGAGCFNAPKIIEGPGVWLPDDQRTPEAIAEHWAEIDDTSAAATVASSLAQTIKFVDMAARAEGNPISMSAEKMALH